MTTLLVQSTVLHVLLCVFGRHIHVRLLYDPICSLHTHMHNLKQQILRESHDPLKSICNKRAHAL